MRTRHGSEREKEIDVDTLEWWLTDLMRARKCKDAARQTTRMDLFTKWERDFIEDADTTYATRGKLSRPQIEVLTRLWARLMRDTAQRLENT